MQVMLKGSPWLPRTLARLRRLCGCGRARGCRHAQYRLGLLYASGQGVAQDLRQALAWYRASAEQGYAPAQCVLGNKYALGQGVKQNYKTAFSWYLKAAEQGDARAQCHLGTLYEEGQGTGHDPLDAEYWYFQAAEQGDAEAQLRLARLYEGNQYMAATWYLKAAEQGVAEAQYMLGNCYATGKGLRKNLPKAFEFYLKAAGQGDMRAQWKRPRPIRRAGRRSGSGGGAGVADQGRKVGFRAGAGGARPQICQWRWRRAELQQGHFSLGAGRQAGGCGVAAQPRLQPSTTAWG
jgi:TPR repeat protein